MSIHDEHRSVSGHDSTEPTLNSGNPIPKELSLFADELFFQVGLMRIVVGLIQEDMENEFLPHEPEVLLDWQRNATNLRYLAEPAFRFLTHKQESLSSDDPTKLSWDLFIRKNMTRLVCFQEVVDSVAENLESANSFEDVKDEIIKPMRRSYIMCDEWQERLIKDIKNDTCDRAAYEISLFDKICSQTINPWDWKYNQAVTFKNLFQISDLIHDLEAKIIELADVDPEVLHSGEISQPPLSICMSTRRLFMAILHAVGTNREIFVDSELINHCHDLFAKAINTIDMKLSPEMEAEHLVIKKSIKALKRRLSLVDLLFTFSPSTPQILEKVAVMSDVKQLTDQERILVRN